MARRPGIVRMACGGVAGLLLASWTSAAAAQPTARFVLSWDAPPGCPTAENVQSRVDALLGGGASASSFADVHASGQVERVDNGFRLLLSMGVGSTPSSRVIEARTCDELAGAAAIAIALLARSTMEDPLPSANSGDTSTSSPADEQNNTPPPAPPAPEPVPNEQDAGASSSSSRLRVVLDAPIGVAGWGSLPSTAFGLGAGLGIRWKTLRVVTHAEAWLPLTERVSGFATRWTLQSAGADACLLRDVAWLELGPCVGAEVQRLTGEGVVSRTFNARSRTTLWVSGTAGIFASLPTPSFEHLRFFGQGRVVISPLRPRFVIDQLGPIHEPALAAPRVDLGCEWIF